jgi:DNA-binding transcriptional ArsR family regulator
LYTTEELDKISILFNVLGNVVRLKILLMLTESKRPLHIRAVASNLKMDYAAVYRHIKTLQRAHLLKIYDVGRSRVLSPMRMEVVGKLLELVKDITT